jgi:glyoxylase-like metal-dependent hydrolase (beta-lactamase superfamily II)
MAAQPAPLASITVGDIKITYLPDGEGHFITAAFMPTSSEEGWALHQEWLDDERRVVTTFGGFLIETGDRKVAVDLGFGDASVEFPGFGTLAGGRYLDSLKQTGVAPEEIDTVVYTHLHVDHTGWTAPGGNLTFSNARHLAGSGEWDHWQQPDESGAGPVPDTVMALGSRLDASADGDTIAPGVTVVATPGHTPGHQSLIVSSGSDRAIILGDVLHCPAQITEQDWGVVFDVDSGLARQTRERLLAELEASETTVAASHFPEAVFGRVLTGEGKRSWTMS